jgi:hypothetical protein
MLALPAAASGEGTLTSASTAPSTPVAQSPAPSAPAAGQMRITLVGLGGAVPFVLAHEAIEVQGRLTPYVAGQRVRVSLYVDGHRRESRTVGIRAHGKGAGEFRLSFRAPAPSRLRVLAAHVATAQMQALAASSRDVSVLAPSQIGEGARGPEVWVLQRALGGLHYAVPQSGSFDEATGDAVIAYRKVTGLARVSYADADMLRRLSHGDGAFHVRYPQDGRHVEANLSLQVLAEIADGHVLNIYPTSSGKPSTPTVTGHFRVYEKSLGFNSESMFDSNYFISGYAIHGYPEVPTYAASHGCLRVPNLDAPSIFAWVQIGTPVDVYF